MPLLNYTEWSRGNAENTHFCNNIFYVDGSVTNIWGKSTTNVFESNVFFGNHRNRPDDPGAITNKAPLMNPGSGGSGFDSLAGYQLRGASDFPRGRIVPNNGGRDFFGGPVPQDRPPCIGVSELTR